MKVADMVGQFIKSMRDKPLWVFAWCLFTLAVGHNVAYEYAFPDIATYFQNKHEELSRLGTEFASAQSLVAMHRNTCYRLVETMQDFSKTIEKSHSTIKEAESLKRQFVDFAIQSRGEITIALSVNSNTSFTDPQLIELRECLRRDLMTLDVIIENRIKFMRSLKNGPVGYDRLAETFNVVVEQRGVAEAATRDRLIDYALSGARTRFNSALREAKAKETIQRYRSRASIACYSYIGFFVGLVLGKMLHNLRMRRRLRTEIDSARKPTSGDGR